MVPLWTDDVIWRQFGHAVIEILFPTTDWALGFERIV